MADLKIANGRSTSIPLERTCIINGCENRLARNNKRGRCKVHRLDVKDEIERKYRKTDTYQNQQLERVYGINLEYYNQLLVHQKGACGMCEGLNPRSRNGRFVVDHDHETKRIRGLLCHPCNIKLGLLGDSVKNISENVNRALNYLNNSEVSLGRQIL